MKYFNENLKGVFYKEPRSFNKYTDREILKYCLGANMYMSATKNILEKIKNKKFENIGCITLCFEDATKESEVNIAEENVLKLFGDVCKLLKEGDLNDEELPLIFLRVRSIDQFKKFSSNLTKGHTNILAGFIFPKFNSSNGEEYFCHLKKLNDKYETVLYGMPIIEDEKVIYKEFRYLELDKIKLLLEPYKDLILNIRVGGTDFSSKFSLRRTVNTSIYDLMVVSDCLTDILNFFTRNTDNYIISAPVFEYFSKDINSKEVQGLLKEIELDKVNGFLGKTVIHPAQVKYVNSMYVVTYEEYIDATNIIENSNVGGVFKGKNDNKMNEVLPHLNWGRKILLRAEAFGVLNEGISNYDLLKKEMV